MTRLGDLLHLGQLLRASGNSYFAQMFSHFFKKGVKLGNFCKGVKIFHISSEIIFGQLIWTFGDFLLVTLTLEVSSIASNYPSFIRYGSFTLRQKHGIFVLG